ncbi:MAG TPA: hypothetical protein VIJ73_19580, partial [Methylomirabilota bacterium]
LRRQVPIHELPLYVRDDSLVVLGPEREYVGQRPAEPLTVEAFVSTEAVFTLRGDAGTVDFRCRRAGSLLTFEASATTAVILRLHHTTAPSAVSADGPPLRRLDGPAFARADAGWTLEDHIVVVKARARRIEVR